MNTKIDTQLASLLADYQVFYQKLRGYHWNVRGPYFYQLHVEFERLYTDAALKVDEVAERIAARGGVPPSSLKRQLELARLEEDGSVPPASDMVRNITRDLESLNGWLRELAKEAEDEDSTTFNLADGYVDEQEKTLWMMRAFMDA